MDYHSVWYYYPARGADITQYRYDSWRVSMYSIVNSYRVAVSDPHCVHIYKLLVSCWYVALLGFALFLLRILVSIDSSSAGAPVYKLLYND